MELWESTDAERCRGAGGGLVVVGDAEYNPRRVGADRVDLGDPPTVGTSLPITSPLILSLNITYIINRGRNKLK